MKLAKKLKKISKDSGVDIKKYIQMLTYKRPHGSQEEKEYIETFILPHADRVDKFGNLYVDIGKNPTVLFSSHTDTVHFKGGRQSVVFNGDFVESADRKDCLGADNATGNFIMLEMIRHGVPGRYIFHRGEEKGGLGSLHIANNEKEELEGILHAVAFDRRGTTDVITFQGGYRCCSEKYAEALSKELGGAYLPCDGGTFTDTATYVDIIPECTNVAVGYYDEHRSSEKQDIDFLKNMIPVLINLPWDSLPIDKAPKGHESLWETKKGGSWGWENDYPAYGSTGGSTPVSYDYSGAYMEKHMIQLIRENPDAVFDMLYEYNLLDVLEDYLY